MNSPKIENARVVKVGDIVKVKILEVDQVRKRIQLSMRLNDTPAPLNTQNTAPKAAKPRDFFPARSIASSGTWRHSEREKSSSPRNTSNLGCRANG